MMSHCKYLHLVLISISIFIVMTACAPPTYYDISSKIKTKSNIAILYDNVDPKEISKIYLSTNYSGESITKNHLLEVFKNYGFKVIALHELDLSSPHAKIENRSDFILAHTDIIKERNIDYVFIIAIHTMNAWDFILKMEVIRVDDWQIVANYSSINQQSLGVCGLTFWSSFTWCPLLLYYDVQNREIEILRKALGRILE